MDKMKTDDADADGLDHPSATAKLERFMQQQQRKQREGHKDAKKTPQERDPSSHE
jgi:hypothetical protein